MPAIGSIVVEQMNRPGKARASAATGSGSWGFMVMIARSTPAASICRRSSAIGVGVKASFSRWK